MPHILLQQYMAKGREVSKRLSNGRSRTYEFAATMNTISRFLAATLLVGTAALSSAQKLTRLTLPVSTVAGGASANATVELSAKAGKEPVVITLASSNAAATAPATVTVPAGQATATFPIATIAVGADTPITIKAKAGAAKATLNFTVLSPRVTEFTFTPITVQGGSNASGIVKLSSVAPVGGAKVTLAANSPHWGGPARFVVNAGSTTGSFTFATIPVVGITDVNVAASLSGSRVVANLNLTPAQFTTFRVTAPTVVGGTATTGLLMLNGPAPKEGFKVNIRSDSSFVVVPFAVTIQAGQNQTTFAITTKPVTTAKTARVSAGGSGAWVELSLDVTPKPAGS